MKNQEERLQDLFHKQQHLLSRHPAVSEQYRAGTKYRAWVEMAPKPLLKRICTLQFWHLKSLADTHGNAEIKEYVEAFMQSDDATLLD